MPILRNWSLLQGGPVSPYKPPEMSEQRLHGRVYGHDSFNDGDEITTTTITKIEILNDEIIVTTRNTSYVLEGAPDPAYEDVYPGARKRLVDWYAGD